jgi:2-dehydro-3-deoxyphosphogalactonate aldolase
MKLDDALEACPVVAIVRGVRPDEALDHVAALLEAGIRSVEVPLNSPEPLESIRRIAGAFGDRMAVGAGTVLTAEQVERVAGVGGRIIVSPNTSQDVIARALELGLDPVPGFATATEAFVGYGAGARRLKLFPAATYGSFHVRQLKAVLPADAVVWAVGGIGPDNFADWWVAGVRAFGLGGELYRAGQTVSETAAKAVRAVGATRMLPLG